MRGVLRTAVLATTAALALSGCGSGNEPIDILSAGGWPGRYSDARNSSTSTVAGLPDVSVAWTRSVGGTVGSPPSIAANGQIFVSASTDAGCNLFAYQIDTGRKRWCTRIAPGVGVVTPVADTVANVYVGEEGGLYSFNEHGQRRWRIPVSGTPRSPQFTGDGNLLAVTHFGQVNVVDTQTGKLVAPIYDMIPVPAVEDGTDVPRQAPDHGLAACFGGSPDCPVATTPAVDLATDRIFVTLWRPGADRAALVALRYTGGDDAHIAQEWSFDDLPGGAVTSPVLSADGATVYVHDGDGTLWAIDSASGSARWSHDPGYLTSTGPAITADGTILLAGGGADGPLVALRDAGDHAESLWQRDDVRQLGAVAAAADGIAYTVVRSPEGLDALVFDASDGTTLDQESLPGASGFAVGTAIGPDGELLVTTLLGDLYTLR
ncbi:PQQ-binding-like beta-propeller repeat protein [Rhodococcus phenolicus]|uniref:outer membrane protein assembly factor BamB family protein n=1 Tax=Rhodococcus phenolicus TaxID=263849 RepID=UPI0008319108|nr:PQQ-binding-like beta-propeller repeat protein [Rhodococcus phenolicus]